MTLKPMTARAAERGLRDLMGLLALPALWVGRDGPSVLQILVEAVERVVSLDLIYIDVPLLPSEVPVQVLRLQGATLPDSKLGDWRDSIDRLHHMPIGAAAFPQRTPMGSVNVVRMSLGYSSQDGSIWFGFNDGTPSVTQLAFLRGAASLGATGLQTARIIYEREQASRAKDEFLAMLGHELRNPLSPIVTSLELIKLRSNGPWDREHAVIERQVTHLRRLVDDLLDVSRIASGKVQLTRGPLQIKSVLFRAIEEVSPLFEERRHQLVVDLPKEGDWVDGDPTRLTQVFANLLSNAGKYTDPGGKICVTARIENGSVTTHIKDNGVGISDEVAPRLFKIFEQGKTSIDRTGGGLGIGLALVKTFVEMHGGTVAASSPGLGLGSDFVVSLPLGGRSGDESCSISAAPCRPAIDAADAVRVLLVDDNVDALESMEILLRESGFTVAAAPGAVEALRLAEAFSPTIAVLDLGLPVMDGYELARELRLRLPSRNPRFIALSGYSQESDREKTIAAGFEMHLVKPIEFEELVSALLTERQS